MSQTLEIRNNSDDVIGSISFVEHLNNLSATRTLEGFHIRLPVTVKFRFVRQNEPVPFIDALHGNLAAVNGQSRVEIGKVSTDADLRGSWNRDGRGETSGTVADLHWRGGLQELAAFERLRAGSTPQFSLWMQGKLHYSHSMGGSGPRLCSEPQDLRINMGEIMLSYLSELWITNVLRRIGAAENVVVEIPLPASPPAPWDGVWEALTTARAAFERGGSTGWNGCVFGVRLALERWRDIEKPDTSQTDPKLRTKRQRLDHLRQSLHQCTHSWVHGTADECSRDDAVLMLATLSSLLAERKP